MHDDDLIQVAHGLPKTREYIRGRAGTPATR